MKKPILVVDGYNMIAFWQETAPFFKSNQLDVAREKLLQTLHNYAHFEHIPIICVFDAQFVPGSRKRYDQYGLEVVFTQEDETADAYIERLALELNDGPYMVSVATSDLNEQWGVFAKGALRVSARELEERASQMKKGLKTFVAKKDLTRPPLRPWNQDQLADLKHFMEDLE